MLTNTANSIQTLRVLNQLAQRYADMVQISVITPDSEQDANNLLGRIHTPYLSFGVDSKRALTFRYMGGSMLFPMAFVAGQMRTIEWSGEAIDLPELLEETAKKPIDTDKYEKISPLLDELQMLIQSRDNRKMRLIASRIFKLDPGNAAALRMRLFYLENTSRSKEAWETLSEQLAAVPGKARLYHTAIDMISRYPQLAGELAAVTDNFLRNIKDPDSCDYMTWLLLDRFRFNSDALKAAVKIYEKSSVESKKQKRSPGSCAGHFTTGALLAAKLGNFTKAIELQQKSADIWKKENNRQATEEAEKNAKYFDLCRKTSVKW
jgi:tetratricopeptide (TPR) repeat protein